MNIRLIKFLSLLFLGILASSCSSLKVKRSSFSNDNKFRIKVLSTTRMIKDLVDEVGGEFVDSLSLINGELDPHSYELVKGDDEKISLADVIFCNGLGLEHSQSLRRNLEENEKSVFLGDRILEKYPDLIINLDGQLDPHIWLDIFLWSHCIEFIKDKLIEIDCEHADYYEERARTVFFKMLDLDNWAKDLLGRIPSNKKYLVSGHNAFNYFVKRYFVIEDNKGDTWKERYCSPEGLSPEAQISSRDIIDVINFIKKFDVSVIFLESNLNGNVLKKVKRACRSNKVRLSRKPLCGDSLGSNSSYFEMFQHNVNLVKQELIDE